MLNKICTRTPARTYRSVRAGLHRDPPAGGAKDEAQLPALRQVTPTNFISGPLAANPRLPAQLLLKCRNICFLKIIYVLL